VSSRDATPTPNQTDDEEPAAKRPRTRAGRLNDGGVHLGSLVSGALTGIRRGNSTAAGSTKGPPIGDERIPFKAFYATTKPTTMNNKRKPKSLLADAPLDDDTPASIVGSFLVPSPTSSLSSVSSATTEPPLPPPKPSRTSKTTLAGLRVVPVYVAPRLGREAPSTISEVTSIASIRTSASKRKIGRRPGTLLLGPSAPKKKGGAKAVVVAGKKRSRAESEESDEQLGKWLTLESESSLCRFRSPASFFLFEQS
jgi:hypothetical protein